MRCLVDDCEKQMGTLHSSNSAHIEDLESICQVRISYLYYLLHNVCSFCVISVRFNGMTSYPDVHILS